MTNKKEIKLPNIINSMNNITSSFNSLKVILISVIGFSLLFVFGCLYYTFYQISIYKDQVYVVDVGNVSLAQVKSSNITLEDEVKDQVTRFAETFFNMSPDYNIIKENVNRLLDYSDKSIYDYYKNLTEKGFYKTLINANAFSQVFVDKINIDLKSYPYKVDCQCFQYIVRQSIITKFILNFQVEVIKVPRSVKNMHGLYIQNFYVTENKIVESRNRT